MSKKREEHKATSFLLCSSTAKRASSSIAALFCAHSVSLTSPTKDAVASEKSREAKIKMRARRTGLRRVGREGDAMIRRLFSYLISFSLNKGIVASASFSRVDALIAVRSTESSQFNPELCD